MQARRRAELICAALLAVMALNLVSQVREKTITNDETVLIPAGYYHLVPHQFHLVYEHPPLCKILAALPLLFLQPNEFDRARLAPNETPIERAWDYEMSFWTDNSDNFEAISFWARLPMIGLTLGLGLLIFVFAHELFGSRAAIFAVALFSLEPVVLAHGRTVQTDVPAAFGFVLLLYLMHRYVAAPGLCSAAWIGVAAALALLAKFSMLLVGPILAVFFVIRLWRSRGARGVLLGHVATICLTTLLVINAAYFFKHRALAVEEIDTLQKSFAKSAAVLVPATKGLSHIVPIEFVLGILWQVTHSASGHTAGLLGMYSKTGWWYYFPVAIALKTGLPFLILSLAAVGWGTWCALQTRDVRFCWLLLPLAVYSVFLLFSGINIGVRYYLPGYALLFLLAGALLARLTRLRRMRHLGVAAVVFFLGCSVLTAARVYPDYMPYMNALAAPRPHWWYLSDSNVEWGDDVGPLARYLRAHGEHRVRAALLGGFVTLQFYGVEYVDFLADVDLLDTRYVALGASFLNGSTVPERPHRTEEQRVNRFAAFRGRTPEAIIGGSIYVYRMHD